jgi:hypothetical protein
MAYTTIDDPSAHFQIALYNGSSSSVTVTNDGNSDLKPDWLWFKKRSASGDHNAFDTSRGLTERIFPNLDSAVDTGSNGITSLTDGFTSGTFYGDVNGAGQTFVTWQWKANGGTTSTNDASATGVGSIDSVIQANTTAGFSIVTHTGSGSSGTIAHGLGATPKWVLTKNRTDNSEDWAIYHVGLSSAEYYIRLNTTAAQAAGSSVWGDTAPSSTVITLGGANGKNNASSKNYVSYCFADIQGYSKFGSYTGNGNEDGPFVYLGFKPKWIMFKNRAAAEEWVLQDTTRDTDNPITKNFRVDSSNAEADASALDIDFLSNGFKNRSDNAQLNSNGVVYIYMAFAEHPFVSSKGAPTTAR